MNASAQELEPYLPELLTWLQDCNWPIAHDVATAIAKCGNALVPHLEIVFEGDDDVWKYWIITGLAPLLSGAAKQVVLEAASRILENPSPGEITEEVVEVASELFKAAN